MNVASFCLDKSSILCCRWLFALYSSFIFSCKRFDCDSCSLFLAFYCFLTTKVEYLCSVHCTFFEFIYFNNSAKKCSSLNLKVLLNIYLSNDCFFSVVIFERISCCFSLSSSFCVICFCKRLISSSFNLIWRSDVFNLSSAK